MTDENSFSDLDPKTNYYKEIMKNVDVPCQSGYLSIKSYENNTDSYQATIMSYSIHSCNAYSNSLLSLFDDALFFPEVLVLTETSFKADSVQR